MPKGGAGEYLVSAAVVMDVHSYQAKLNKDRTVMSQYRLAFLITILQYSVLIFRFVLNGHKELEAAPLYSDAGKDDEADLVQASRSIVWHLKEGESLALKKMDTRHPLSPEAALDHRITFCVTLLHLDESLTQGMSSKLTDYKLINLYTISLDLAAPPTKKNVPLEEWKYEAPSAILSSTITHPTSPTHPAVQLPNPLPSTHISEDCSLSEICSIPSVLTSQKPPVSNAP